MAALAGKGSDLHLAWADMTKGFAVTLVVVGHVWRGLDLAGFLSPQFYSSVDVRIYAFHMPLFFLVSGLFFVGTLNKQNPVRFLQSRVLRLIYPLLLWTYIFIFTKLAAGSMTNTPIGVEELLISPIPGRWHFWFLWALFLIHISMLLVKPLLISEKYQTGMLLALLAVSIALNTVSISGPVGFWAGQALKNLLYFAIGMNIGKHFLGVRIPLLACFFAVAVFVGIQIWLPQMGRAGVPGELITTFLILSVAVVLIWLGDRGGWISQALEYVGKRSMAIFLAHVVFTAGIREVLLKAGTDSLVVHLMLGTAFGLIIPIVMHNVARRLKLMKVLGF